MPRQYNEVVDQLMTENEAFRRTLVRVKMILLTGEPGGRKLEQIRDLLFKPDQDGNTLTDRGDRA